MMTTIKYHYTLGMPVVRLPRTIKLEYSKHSLTEARKDGLLPKNLPWLLDTSLVTIIEQEYYSTGILRKLLFRMAYCNGWDLLLAVGERGKVLTVWLNKSTDRHHTLDCSQYVQWKG